jgi:hypothetical protein
MSSELLKALLIKFDKYRRSRLSAKGLYPMSLVISLSPNVPKTPKCIHVFQSCCLLSSKIRPDVFKVYSNLPSNREGMSPVLDGSIF